MKKFHQKTYMNSPDATPVNSGRGKNTKIRKSRPKIENFSRVDSFSDFGGFSKLLWLLLGEIRSRDNSFISIKTPNNKQIKMFSKPIVEETKQHKTNKTRHSKNPTAFISETPYSIFLNIQPNISIIKGRLGCNRSIGKLNSRKSYFKQRNRI